MTVDEAFGQWLTYQNPDQNPSASTRVRTRMLCALFVSIANNHNQPSSPIFAHTTITTRLFCQGCPRRIQQQQQSLSPAAPPTTLRQPEQAALDSSLEQMVLRITFEYTRPDSTSSIYDAKSNEYFVQYCTSLYPNDPYAKVLSQYKVYRFIFYQSFRNQKKEGEKARTVQLALSLLEPTTMKSWIDTRFGFRATMKPRHPNLRSP
jgi:hypothetical protein